GLEVDLSPAAVGDVGVALRCPEIGMPEHLLDAAEVGASLEQMRRKRVPEEMRMDALGLEPGLVREASQYEKRSRARERSSTRVQEELRAVASIEMWASEREEPAHRLGRLPPDRYESFLATLSEGAHDTLFEVDRALLEPDG